MNELLRMDLIKSFFDELYFIFILYKFNKAH